MRLMDVNCDLGELSDKWDYSLSRDIQLLEYVSSINLACGMHAGDARTMHLMVEEAVEKGVEVGAHPSYPDKEGFGRRSMNLSAEELYDVILFQLGSLQVFLRLQGVRMHHVKPHGALYNDAADNPAIARIIAKAVHDFDSGLILYGLAGSELIAAGNAIGLSTAKEAFVDRTYLNNGRLSPRSDAGSVIDLVEEAMVQARQLIEGHYVRTREGGQIQMDAQTICLHGDGAHVLSMAQALRALFADCNIRMKAV